MGRVQQTSATLALRLISPTCPGGVPTMYGVLTLALGSGGLVQRSVSAMLHLDTVCSRTAVAGHIVPAGPRDIASSRPSSFGPIGAL
jgi:hypothetical protein